MFEQQMRLRNAMKVSKSLTRLTNSEVFGIPPPMVVPYYNSDRQYNQLKFHEQMAVMREKQEEMKDVRI
jgi:hypothetical protein